MTGEQTDGWRRLHPLTILKEMGALAWAIVAAIVFDFDWEIPYPWVPEGAGPDSIIAVGVFIYAVLRYLFTAYRITDQSVDLRRGVIVKTNQSMPRERVQTVTVTTGLIGRFVGVSTVEVSAADTEDITLAYVSSAHADGLRRILERVRQVQSDDGESVDEDRVGIAELPPGRLVVYVLTDGWLLVSIAGLAVGVIITLTVGFSMAPFTFVAVLGGWAALRAVGLIGFKSWLRPDRVETESGLLSRRNSEAPLARIQAVGVSRPVVRRLIGHETVEMTTGELSLGSDAVALTKGMVAPLVEIGAWRRLAEALIGHVELGEVDLRPSSPHAIRRSIVRGVGVSLAAGAVVVPAVIWLDVGWWLPAGIVVAGVALSVLYARARYRALGWAVDDRHLMVRRGVLDRRLAIVPIGKVQSVVVSATPFQRRMEIATVRVDTAGIAMPGSAMSAGVEAIDLTQADARHLADHLVEAAARISLPDGV